MATLQILLPDGEQTHELVDDIITIGRVSDNTIQIDDPSVSSHHARITSLDGKFDLEDLGSTNGTRINGQNETKGTLTDGTRVRFGKVETVFQSGLPGASIPLPQAEGTGVTVADSTKRPTDFVNASPFGKRSSKKDTLSMAIMAFGILALLGGLAAVGMALMVKAPL